MGNMVATDSLIATFDAKYTYSFWRPVTAIRHTNPDGSYSATPINTWMPAVMTPSFPEYVAGHGSFVSAQAELYTQFFGTPQIEIDLDSTVTGTTRHFATADDLRTEIINARTWGGLHFRSSSELAVALGQQLVADALSQFLGADPASDTGQHALHHRRHPQVRGRAARPGRRLAPTTWASTSRWPSRTPPPTPARTTTRSRWCSTGSRCTRTCRPTLLRGYVQLSTSVVPGAAGAAGQRAPGRHGRLRSRLHCGVTPPHYLGPTIVATKDRPVRILFRNLLPTGIGGDLFIPVDTTVMGSGMGPDHVTGCMETDPQNPMCGMGYDMDGIESPRTGCYTENRATLHLHGGITPWISDGTPHQWITPAGENTPYPQGVSVRARPRHGRLGRSERRRA